MKFGLLNYSTREVNVGDEVQSLAAKQFLPKIDQYFHRDHVDATLTTEEVKLIMNGWYMWHPENWPFKNEHIKPLLTSFHIHKKDMLKPEAVEFYKKHGPIGARDLHTLSLLQEKGVDAFFSGCLTLTLKNKFDYRSNGIYVVDVPDKIRKFIPDRVKARYLTHTVSREHFDNHEYKFDLAEELLNKYARAKFVITSRLHCALPCLALGTPVLFIPDNYFVSKKENDPRFAGLLEYLNYCSFADLESGTYVIDFNNPKPNPKDIAPIRDPLIKSCIEFIGEDVYHKAEKYIQQTGVSVICAVKDRTDNLKKALKTWLAQKEIEEIVIVDWDSKKPIKGSLSGFLHDKRIKIVRVENQPRWILSKAYNLAAKSVTKSKILKLDADIILHDNFFKNHILKKGIFYKGDGYIARNSNETHLTGTTFFNKDEFDAVGGYNEFITTYGHDDIDLYRRLVDKNIVEKDLHLNSLYHIPHNGHSRIMYQPQVKGGDRGLINENLKNKNLSLRYVWNKNRQEAKYTVTKVNENFYIAKEHKINSYILSLYRKIYIKFTFFEVINRENLDRRIGLAGIYLKKLSPRLYHFSRKILKGV